MGDVVQMQGDQGAEQSAETQRSRGPAVNAVHLLGRLTADPEMRYTPEGTAVTTMRLAVNDRAEAEFIDTKAFGQLAETVARYQRKGSQLYLTGRLHVENWKGQDGGNRRTVWVIAGNVQFLGRPQSEQS